MVSYADFDHFRARRRKAMEVGLRAFLDVPEGIGVYLDNGSFAFHRKGREVPRDEYLAFVRAAKPDWYPPPQDYIPLPSMSRGEQAACVQQTMAENLAQRETSVRRVSHVYRDLRCSIHDLRADTPLA